jgi:hypothetical protein
MTTTAQDELPLFRCAKDDANVQNFLLLLLRHSNWMTAAEVLRALGMAETETNRRHVRAWAEATEEEVISGQEGYRHTDCATADEIHHFCSWMESQGNKMKFRAARTRARAHKNVG